MALHNRITFALSLPTPFIPWHNAIILNGFKVFYHAKNGEKDYDNLEKSKTKFT